MKAHYIKTYFHTSIIPFSTSVLYLFAVWVSIKMRIQSHGILEVKIKKGRVALEHLT